MNIWQYIIGRVDAAESDIVFWGVNLVKLIKIICSFFVFFK